VTRPRLPKHVHAFTDRHGHARHYLRIPGRPSAALPNPIEGWDAFMRAVEAARLEAEAAPRKLVRVAAPGSVDDLVTRYYRSAEFLATSKETQRTRRGIIERMRRQHGAKPVSHITEKVMRDAMARRVTTPAAANNFLKVMRLLMTFAVSQRMLRDNPTRDVPRLKVRTAGFATWTEEDIAQYEATHPPGSRARLAMALGLYLGQRRGDVVRLGRQHVRGRVITVLQAKTGSTATIRIHPELHAELARLKPGQLTFLQTAYGKPYTPAGFGNAFREWLTEAGLPPHLSFHGLRKAAARRLAEAGASAREIMSVTGHTSLAEAERYTRAVDQARLSDQAADKVEAAFPPKAEGEG